MAFKVIVNVKVHCIKERMRAIARKIGYKLFCKCMLMDI